MSDFSEAWQLSRSRFINEFVGLTDAQLRWKFQPNALSIGQMAIHLAGVETFFGSQLAQSTLDEFEKKLARTSTEGVVNEDQPFPFTDDEIDAELVMRALRVSEAIWKPLIEQATPEIRKRELVSALGPVITGEGAFARLSFHSGYHQGQAYLIKSMAGFPA